MNLLDSIKAALRKNNSNAPQLPYGGGLHYGYGSSWLADVIGGHLRANTCGDWAGSAGDLELNSLVALAQSYLAMEAAKTPLIVQMFDDKYNDWAPDVKHQANEILENPNPLHSFNEIIGATIVDISYGDAIWWIGRGGSGRPAEIWWYPRHWWHVENRANNQLMYRLQTGVEVRELEASEVIHFRLPRPDPKNIFRGYNPLAAQLPYICVDNEAAQYTHGLMKNRAISPLLVMSKSLITETQKQAAREDWAAKTRGSKQGNLTFIEGGDEIKELSNTVESLALKTITDQPEARVMAAFGLNARAMQLPSAQIGATFNNTAEANKAAWDKGIAPKLELIAAKLTRRLLTEFDAAPAGTAIARDATKRRFYFDYSNIPELQEDEGMVQSRANAAFAAGGMTENELRIARGQEPYPEGDPRGERDAFTYKTAGAAQPDGQPAPDSPMVPDKPEVKAFDPRQPRDDHGKWTDSAGRLSVGHAIAVMKHEGVTNGKYASMVRASIEDGTHQTREDVLRHIDAIHATQGKGSAGQGEISNFNDGVKPVNLKELSQPEFDKEFSARIKERNAVQKISGSGVPWEDWAQRAKDRYLAAMRRYDEADREHDRRMDERDASNDVSTEHFSPNPETPKTARLAILEESLRKKEALFDQKIGVHFDDVRGANGQPLNDKRNGGATLDRWERQNNALRTLKEGIEKTKNAIEREKDLISNVNISRDSMHPQIADMVNSGELVQWRKHPNRFFVPGVEKARIVHDEKTGDIYPQYHREIADPEQYKKFAQTYNQLRANIRESKSIFDAPFSLPSLDAATKAWDESEHPRDKGGRFAHAANAPATAENIRSAVETLDVPDARKDKLSVGLAVAARQGVVANMGDVHALVELHERVANSVVHVFDDEADQHKAGTRAIGEALTLHTQRVEQFNEQLGIHGRFGAHGQNVIETALRNKPTLADTIEQMPGAHRYVSVTSLPERTAVSVPDVAPPAAAPLDLEARKQANKQKRDTFFTRSADSPEMQEFYAQHRKQTLQEKRERREAQEKAHGYKRGDWVQRKSGGDLGTVESVHGEKVRVNWHNNARVGYVGSTSTISARAVKRTNTKALDEVKRYDPTEPRDSGGRWTSGAAFGKGTRATKNLRASTIEEVKEVHGLTIPKNAVDVQISDDKNADFLGSYVEGAGREQKRWLVHPEYQARQDAAKHNRVAQLHHDLPGMMETINKEIESGGANAHQALTLRLIAKSSFRNGGEGGKGKEVAYGASNLETRHAKVAADGATIHFDFIGKENVRQQHTIHDPILAAHILARQASGKKTIFDGNDKKTLTYLAKITPKAHGDSYKVHDFRTHYASDLADDLVRKSEKKTGAPTSPDELEHRKKWISYVVSRHLGNEQEQSLTTYINPAVWHAWEKAATGEASTVKSRARIHQEGVLKRVADKKKAELAAKKAERDAKKKESESV